MCEDVPISDQHRELLDVEVLSAVDLTVGEAPQRAGLLGLQLRAASEHGLNLRPRPQASGVLLQHRP